MKQFKYIIPLFIIACIIQWWVPLSMILSQEKTISVGNSFKFETLPIDPHDPYRGKYIVLNFKANRYQKDSFEKVARKQPAYVSIDTDSLGFARVKDVSLEIPASTSDYVKAYVRSNGSGGKLFIEYPFNKYYMDEFKALPAEQIVRSAQRDSSTVCYAIVKLLDGKAALKDVMINDVSIKEAVENQSSN